MARSDAFAYYRKCYAELYGLIATADDRDGKKNKFNLPIIAKNQMARSVVVLLAGCVEGYLNTISAAILLLTNVPWENCPPLIKRLLLMEVTSDFTEILTVDEGEKLFNEDADVEKLRRRLIAKVGWLQNAAPAKSMKVKDLYGRSGFESLGKFLGRLRPDNTNFIAWLDAQPNTNIAEMRTVFDAIVKDRTALAHGGMVDSSLTVGDARKYLAVATKIVRSVDIFLISAYPQLDAN